MEMDACSYFFTEFGEVSGVRLLSEGQVVFGLPFGLFKGYLDVGTVVDSTLSGGDVGFVGSEPYGTALLMKREGQDSLPKVESDRQLDGIKYKVSFEFEFARGESTDNEGKNGSVAFHEQVKALRNGWYHLLFCFASGRQALVRASRDTWQFSYEESDGKTTGSIVIENISGIQPLRRPS